MVTVSLEGNASSTIEYELNPQIPLVEHVELLGDLLKVDKDQQHKYGLRFTNQNRMVSIEDSLANISPTSSFVFCLKPKYEAMSLLQKVAEQKDPVQLKTSFFYLKKKLSDQEFAQAFVAQNGIQLMTVVMMSLTGNALAYCLQALEAAMSYEIGWEGILDEHIQKLFSFIGWDEDGTNKTNVVNCALRIGVLLAASSKYGYTTINRVILENASLENKQPYAGAIACIGSTSDLNMQMNGLKLVNNLIKSAPNEETRKEFFSTLMKLGIHKVLQRQIHIENQNWKEQIISYQYARLEQYNKLRLESYDKNNSAHETLLMQLWKAVFPDQELKSRVSQQWKEMGFQGTDPATDFRGMGLLGLYNLIYIAENHPVIFRRIVKEQSSREDNDYPVAVTGISITQLLFTLFKIGEEKQDPIVYNILFDHDYAFEEMYCIIFQLLDRTWDEMNAAYMDFPRVLNAVKEKVFSVIKTSDTLSSFQRGCSKGTIVEAIQRSEQNQVPQITVPSFDVPQHIVDEITSLARAEVKRISETKKKQFMKTGSIFKELVKKGKHQNQSYIHMVCTPDEKQLLWERVASGSATAENLTNTIAIEDLAVVLTGQNNPAFAKLKKADEDILNNGFSLQLQDGTCFDFIAQSREDYVHWTDGIRLLLGFEMETIETQSDMDVLCSADICVRLMNIEGIEIPDELEIPPPPANYNFFMRDNKEMEMQAVGL